MKPRQERIEVRITRDKSIRLYDSTKKTPISEWQIQSGNSIADTIVSAGHGKVWVEIDEEGLYSSNAWQNSGK